MTEESDRTYPESAASGPVPAGSLNFCSECGHKFSPAPTAPNFCSACGVRVGLSRSAEPTLSTAAYANLDALLQATAAAKSKLVFSPGAPTLMGVPRAQVYAPTLMGIPRSELFHQAVNQTINQTLMGAPLSYLYSPARVPGPTFAGHSARGQRKGEIYLALALAASTILAVIVIIAEWRLH